MSLERRFNDSVFHARDTVNSATRLTNSPHINGVKKDIAQIVPKNPGEDPYDLDDLDLPELDIVDQTENLDLGPEYKDVVGQYLKDIRHDILKHEEEVTLDNAIKTARVSSLLLELAGISTSFIGEKDLSVTQFSSIAKDLIPNYKTSDAFPFGILFKNPSKGVKQKYTKDKEPVDMRKLISLKIPGQVTEDDKKTESDKDNERLFGEIPGTGDFDPLPIFAQQQKLEANIRKGIDARKELISHNLRLVVTIAKRYSLSNPHALQENIQNGNLGLLKAVEKYDSSLGWKFSTYATWWIRQTITRERYDTARTIRLPVHMEELAHEVARAEVELATELGRTPSDWDIARLRGIPVDKIKDLRLALYQQPNSYDMPVNPDDEETAFSEYIPDIESNTEAEGLQRTLGDDLKNALSFLKSQERELLTIRFGLDGNGGKTLLEAGRLMQSKEKGKIGVTRERARQIEASALKKLRNSPGARGLLRAYLES